MPEISPAEFDFDAWLSGASRPTRSVKVYRRGDLLAELDELADQIERTEIAATQEESLADSGDNEALRQQYAELSEEFGRSALTIRVTALNRDEIADVVLKANKAGANISSREMTFWHLSESATPKMTPEQWGKLAAVVGDAQFDQIILAVDELSDGKFEPSADFLPKPSTQGKTEE